MSTRTGLPREYSTVTWLLPSGSRYPISPLLRASASRRATLCASEIGSGISSGVSLLAKPIIMPWAPAPVRSYLSLPAAPERASRAVVTPAEISALCSLIATITPLVVASNPCVECV